MKASTSWACRAVSASLITALSLFIIWCAVNYQIYVTEGYVTDVFKVDGSEYDYFIRTEVDLFQCRIGEEEYLIIGEERHLSVMYGEYPTGERTCLYIGI